MKKFAVLAVFAAISGGAYAQSSVTLFGIIDEAARYTKNGDQKLKSLVSGGINSSRRGQIDGCINADHRHRHQRRRV